METVKYVIDSLEEENSEIPAKLHKQASSLVAARSKAKAKPQPRELAGTDSNHTNTPKKMD